MKKNISFEMDDLELSLSVQLISFFKVKQILNSKQILFYQFGLVSVVNLVPKKTAHYEI